LGPQCDCVMVDDALSCSYEDLITEELSCYQNYNAECDDVQDSYHEVEITLTESQRNEMRLTRGDLTQFISSQLCQESEYCMIPPNGVSVGEIADDGTVVIWLNMTSASEVAEWSLRASIEDALRVGEIQAAIAEAQEQQATEQVSSAASTSEEGGGMMMFAAAGAVVVIIIIVVMKRGSNKGAAASRKADRTVVAFENPMYADGNAGGAAGYDQGDAGGEGLYDEPAFNGGNVPTQNPMYESTEDLTAGGGDDDAGDDGGYLDVAPEEDE